MAKQQFNKLKMQGVGRSVRIWINGNEMKYITKYSLESGGDFAPYAYLNLTLIVDNLDADGNESEDLSSVVSSGNTIKDPDGLIRMLGDFDPDG